MRAWQSLTDYLVAFLFLSGLLRFTRNDHCVNFVGAQNFVPYSSPCRGAPMARPYTSGLVQVDNGSRQESLEPNKIVIASVSRKRNISEEFKFCHSSGESVAISDGLFGGVFVFVWIASFHSQ